MEITYTITTEMLIEHCEREIKKCEVFAHGNPLYQKRLEEHQILLRFLKGETVEQIFGVE